MTAALPVRFRNLGSGDWWQLIAAYKIRGGGGIGGGISGSRIAAMLAATAPPGGWDDRWGRRQEVAGEGDLMLSGGVVYGDAGL